MKAWVMAMILWLFLCCLGKIVTLYKRDEVRLLNCVAVDAVLEIVLLVWGVWELANI